MPEVFHAVALECDPRIPDGKSLVDATFLPGVDPDAVLRDFQRLSSRRGFDRTGFWLDHTETPDYTVRLPGRVALLGATMPEEVLGKHVAESWVRLSYHERAGRGARLPTEYPDFRAGAGSRFGERYGWDGEMGMRGLLAQAETSPQKDWLVRRAVWTVRNSANIIDDQEFDPNGFTEYLCTRPQLPVTYRRVQSLQDYFNRHPEEIALHFHDSETDIMEEFLPQIVREYEWWMRPPRAVTVENGLVINIPSDDADGPRVEMYAADVQELKLALKAPDVDETQFYKNKRIATATGRDFTGRFCTDPDRPETVCASVIAPIELQAELLRIEKGILAQYEKTGRSVKAAELSAAVNRREASIETFWDPIDGCYYDRKVTGQLVRYPNIATAYAVTAGAGDKAQQEDVAHYVHDNLLVAGGLVTSLRFTGNQWDWPNIFPYDEEEGHQLFYATGHEDWAHEAEDKWLSYELDILKKMGVFAEKHDSVSKTPKIGNWGEYPPQPDTEWTIALVALILHRRGFRASHPIAVPEHELLVVRQGSRI
jgi:alpha,alpha-trehalase